MLVRASETNQLTALSILTYFQTNCYVCLSFLRTLTHQFCTCKSTHNYHISLFNSEFSSTDPSGRLWLHITTRPSCSTTVCPSGIYNLKVSSWATTTFMLNTGLEFQSMTRDGAGPVSLIYMLTCLCIRTMRNNILDGYKIWSSGPKQNLRSGQTGIGLQVWSS